MTLRSVMSLRIARVLARLPASVQKRYDRRIHPVVCPVLGAIAQLASPHPAAHDGAPEIANELFRVIARVDDPVILSDQLVARVLRDLAELVVDVGDEAARVCGCDDCGLVEGLPHLLEPADGIVDDHRWRLRVHLCRRSPGAF